jgi:hypothetical protein
MFLGLQSNGTCRDALLRVRWATFATADNRRNRGADTKNGVPTPACFCESQRPTTLLRTSTSMLRLTHLYFLWLILILVDTLQEIGHARKGLIAALILE